MSRSLPTLRRTVVAVSTAAGAILGLGGLLLQPTFPDDPAAYIDILANSPTAAIGVQLYVWSQVFWVIGLVGAGHIVSRRAPVFGVLGALLIGLGAFAHTVYGGVMVLDVAIAADPDAATAVMEASQSGAFLPFLAVGLVGTVLGIALLAIGLIRSRVAPLWVAVALLAWVVIEFVLTNFIDWATYASIALGIIAFVGLAVALWRSDRAEWETVAEASVSVPAGELAV